MKQRKKSVVREKKAREILQVFWMTRGFRLSGPRVLKCRTNCSYKTLWLHLGTE